MSGKPIDEGVLDRALCAWFNDATGAGLDGGPEHREWRTRMAAALTAAQQQGQAVACPHCKGNPGLDCNSFGRTAPPSAPVGVEAKHIEALRSVRNVGVLYVEEREAIDAIITALAQRPAAAHQDAVTRESALDAIEHVTAHNGPGRDREAVAMLVSAQQPAQQPAAVDEAMAERFCRRWYEITGRSLERAHVLASLDAALATQHQEPTT